MYMKCCNPECDAPFDYREGRLMRVSKVRSKSDSGEEQRFIEHFWLCGRCAVLFVLEYKSGMAVTVKRRDAESLQRRERSFVSAA
jgi:hypothetical protein